MASTSQPLAGRAAIITGAGSGLGRSYAIALAAAGASVVVNDLPEAAARASEVTAEIIEAGGTATTCLVSIADLHGGDRVVASAIESSGRLDIAISNAGVLRSALFPEVSDDVWDLHSSVHLAGTFRLARAAWPHLVNSDAGRLVLTTSAGGLFGAPGLSAYGAAKLGIVGLLKVLAVEAAGTPLRINAIAPLAWTPMSAAGGRTGSTAQILGPERFTTFDPNHPAEAVVVLSHPDCPASGQIFSVGGGRVAEVLIAETNGATGSTGGWQGLLANWEAVTDRSALAFPQTMRDEVTLFVQN